uniref:UDP-sugar pyrophosphorylase n=1 Tax=Rhizophora mucronata TaxID=61149 RepID=A0A2P2K6K8_RHIMU
MGFIFPRYKRTFVQGNSSFTWCQCHQKLPRQLTCCSP